MTDRSQKISAVFPCLNEEKNIPAILAAAQTWLSAVAKNYEIIMVNDGSTDGSAAVLAEAQKNIPALTVIEHPHNLGYGTSLKDGMLAASGDLIFYMDADNQFDIREMARLLERIGGCDAVIGYRGRRSDHIIRRINGKLWNGLLALLLGLRYRDIDCGFKLFRRTALDPALVTSLQSQGGLISGEILARLLKKGCRVCEVKVAHYPRQHGTATGNSLTVIVKSFRDLLKLYAILK